ncbi:SDR family NAD(P)-dependent oxidoreductase [Uliginosibacterium aquaticum]|uniref:SDR family NAD(P)-dependent oxidoreductase n=1 Tax=Uliginosibacterium aquaticum TaxID=2731212 RepID=A0ABX2IBI7_9RHOO|nr:SDR family NAD(P)-dependent oxidoreductase [Uliginosibacterium aquaticum]NSL53795.1 SDR family NAD(P)-dependent oxidoreductase [Uliginosibacterium aquaticum]
MDKPIQTRLERSVVDKNFVFFGGSTGMGKAAALELGRRGASILIVGRSREAGEAAVAEIRQAGAGSAAFLQGDLSTVAGVATVAAGVKAWRPVLHGVMHTAMSAFPRRMDTVDGFEFAFALQYFARAALNRLLLDALAASGDGRIVHIGGDVPGLIKADLDDLQFQQRQWGFMKSILTTHVLGALNVQEAARRWHDLPVSIAVSCVGSTKTKAMLDSNMPWFMRLMGRFGASPEFSARNAVRFLTAQDVQDANGASFRKPKVYKPEPISKNPDDAARLWHITGELAAERGLSLP